MTQQPFSSISSNVIHFHPPSLILLPIKKNNNIHHWNPFSTFSSMTTSIMIPMSSFTTTYSIISILCILNCCQIFSCPSPWHHLDATIIIIIIVCDPLLPEKNQRMHPCTWWPLDICSGFRSWTHDVVVDCDDGADYWWYQQLFFWTCEEKADPPPPPAKWQHGGNWKLIWPKSQGGGII